MVIIDVWPNPVTADGRRTRIGKASEAGVSVAELVRREFGPDVNVTVLVNRTVTPQAEWDDITIPDPEADSILKSIAIRPTPEGGADGSNPYAVVGSIAATILAPHLAGAILPAALEGGKLAAGLTALFTTGGIIAVNTIFSPRLPRADDASQRTDQYSIEGGANRVRQYEPLLLLLGTHRVFPDYAALPYQEYDNNGRQFANQLFDFGIGNLDIENERVGETLLSDYNSVETELGNGASIGVMGNVDTIDGEDLVRGDPALRTTPHDTTRLMVDLLFNHYEITEKNATVGHHVEFRVRYRRDFENQWTSPNPISFANPHNANGRNPVRRTVTFEGLPPAKYHVEVSLETIFPNESRRYGTATLVSVRAGQDETADFDGRNPYAMRILASGQLYGRVDSFNADVHQLVPTWDGNAWTGPVRTSNPAWIYRKYLLGFYSDAGTLMAGMGLAPSRIDDDRIKAWGAFCDANGLSCNLVIESQMDHAEVLLLITQCGWASPSRSTGKWGVVFEDEATLPVAVFTPANIVVGTASVAYENEGLADEIIGNFYDAASDYQQNTLRRKTPGVTNPRKPVTIPLDGITDAVQAAKEINRTAAAQFYHNRVVSFETGVEGEMIDRGDAVSLATELIAGGKGGRLLSIDDARTTLRIGGTIARNGHAWVSLPDGTMHSTGYVRVSQDTITLNAALPALPVGIGDDPMSYRYSLFDSPGDASLFRVTHKEQVPERRFRFTLRDDPDGYYDARTDDLSVQFLRTPRRPQITNVTVTENVKDITGGFVILLNLFVAGNQYLSNVVIRVNDEVVGTYAAGELIVVSSPVNEGQVVITVTPGNEFFTEGNPYTLTYEISGKTWAPPDVTGLSVTVTSDGTRTFSWPLVGDDEVRQNGGYEIRFAPSGSSTVAWNDMRVLVTGPLSSPLELNSPPAGSWQLSICAIDSAGRYSNNPYSIVADLPAAGLDASILTVCPGDIDWPGILTGGIRDGDSIAGASGGDWTDPASWGAFDEWGSGEPGTIQYVTQPIDLDTSRKFQVRSTYQAEGDVAVHYREDNDDAENPGLTDWAVYTGQVLTTQNLVLRYTVNNTTGTPVLRGLCYSLITESLLPEGGDPGDLMQQGADGPTWVKHGNVIEMTQADFDALTEYPARTLIVLP